MPAQLPRDLSTFVGRDCELSRLNSLVNAKDAQSEAPEVTALLGMAGIGKTTLGGSLGASNSRSISRWASLLESPRARSGRARDGSGRGAADRAGGLRGARSADPGEPGGPGRALPQHAGRPAGADRARQRLRRRAGTTTAAGLGRLPGDPHQPHPADQPGRHRRCPADAARTAVEPRRPATAGPAAGRATGRVRAGRGRADHHRLCRPAAGTVDRGRPRGSRLSAGRGGRPAAGRPGQPGRLRRR